MKLYQIKQPISLSFLTPQDQYDVVIDPIQRQVKLGFDGKDIYLISKSITTNNAIEEWINEGKIEEIND